MEIEHIFNIESVEIPDEIKDEPIKARLEGKRIGKLLRLLKFEDTKEKKEIDFRI
ncbi:MAG: hypothetical protein U9Q69_04830 [Nanoarchaeota archaeon]|nr:hypothetical protein [Nanoarchaeota archaeon]